MGGVVGSVAYVLQKKTEIRRRDTTHICKKIMDEHDGLMRVESDVGKGSTFSLFFHMK